MATVRIVGFPPLVSTSVKILFIHVLPFGQLILRNIIGLYTCYIIINSWHKL